jgi:CMP/dCMP kinase
MQQPQVSAAARREQIAIDGPAASGKSTVARRVAADLHAVYLNTGALYRAVARAALEAGIDPAGEPGTMVGLLSGLRLEYRLEPGATIILMLNGRPVAEGELRTPEVAQGASDVARLPGVRQWLLDRQRAAADLGLVVMEGRDIGTVVFPHARHKFFITASPEERARRRLAQTGEVAAGATLASVAAEIARRDWNDANRAVAPLRAAEDAILIDTTTLTIDEVVTRVLGMVRGRWSSEE